LIALLFRHDAVFFTYATLAILIYMIDKKKASIFFTRLLCGRW